MVVTLVVRRAGTAVGASKEGLPARPISPHVYHQCLTVATTPTPTNPNLTPALPWWSSVRKPTATNMVQPRLDSHHLTLLITTAKTVCQRSSTALTLAVAASVVALPRESRPAGPWRWSSSPT